MSGRINLLLCLIFGHSWVRSHGTLEEYRLKNTDMNRGFRGKWCSNCHAFRMFEDGDEI